MAFFETSLPDHVEKGAVGGPGFKTSILTLSSGFEKRNIDWSRSRGQWDISYGITNLQNLRDVIAHFYSVQGKAHGFRFKDWSDYQVPDSPETQSFLGTGDAAETEFQAIKRYTNLGGQTFDRIINKIVDGSVSAWLNGTPVDPMDFTVDNNTGIITFDSPPGGGVAITFACEFDVPVRFDTDELEINTQTFQAGLVPRIPIVEIRV